MILGLRALRLEPLLITVIMINWFIMPGIGWGPFWNRGLSGENGACSRTWFANVFFFNNIWPRPTFGEPSCAQWTWYLGADFQMWLLVPPLAALFIWKARMAVFACVTLVAASTAAILGISWHYGIAAWVFGEQVAFPFVCASVHLGCITISVTCLPSLMVLLFDRTSLFALHPMSILLLSEAVEPTLFRAWFFPGLPCLASADAELADKIYFLPHTRFQPFGMGILLAFGLFHRSRSQSQPALPWGSGQGRHLRLATLLMALGLIALPMFVTTGLYSSFPEPGWQHQWQHSLFLSTSKICWSLGLTLMCITCVFPSSLKTKLAKHNISNTTWDFPGPVEVSDITFDASNTPFRLGNSSSYVCPLAIGRRMSSMVLTSCHDAYTSCHLLPPSFLTGSHADGAVDLKLAPLEPSGPFDLRRLPGASGESFGFLIMPCKLRRIHDPPSSFLPDAPVLGLRS